MNRGCARVGNGTSRKEPPPPSEAGSALVHISYTTLTNISFP
jgi:hypothetical protein